MTRVTPTRPVDVAEILPGLAALARPAVRLHPHPGSLSPFESSVGGRCSGLIPRHGRTVTFRMNRVAWIQLRRCEMCG